MKENSKGICKEKNLYAQFVLEFGPWQVNIFFRTQSTILRRIIEVEVSYSGKRSFQEGNFHSSCCKSNQGPQELGESQILEAKCLVYSCCGWRKKQDITYKTYV